MRQTRKIGILVACVFVPAVTLANSIIPAPLIWQGALMGTNSILRYILSVGLICVGIEAAIYKYLPQFEYPIRDSLVANAVSTVLGIPLGFLSAMANDEFFIATCVSIIIECSVICRLEKQSCLKTRKAIIWPVVIANVVSNVLIFALLIWKIHYS